MNKSSESNSFAARLLQLDQPLNQSEYMEYRMKLESALETAERRERLAGRLAMVSIPIAVLLMFIGGSGVFGSFDPTDRDASVVSVGLGAIYCIAAVVGLISLASYCSRFRPRIFDVKEKLRDANLFAIQCELAEIRKEISRLSKSEDSQ